ncbi:sciellin isoform X1 [Seriola dumerili]|uniref:sciellin isoform X1 n=1 Tax=Seriola dumerili TaxID=41447 RepID=UPI000BBE9A25|nr:sciellin isoform X1 [Seriola dumerili]
MSRYTSQTSRSTRPSQAIEDSKKKSSLLKDNSWIKRADDEDEDVDRDPNFGKSVLNRYRSNESLESSGGEETKTTKTISTSTSVHALTKRFSGSQDELRSSTIPSSKTTTSYTKSSYSSLKSDSPSTTTTSIITKDGKTTETTTTTTQSLRSPVIKSPTKTDMFTERVLSSSKGTLYSNISPTRTTKVTETTVTSIKGAEDKLYDTPRVIPTSVKDDISPTDSKTTVSTTETVVVKSRTDTNSEDKLYDTLIPTSIKGDVKDSKTTVSSTETVTVKSSTNGDDIKTTTTTRTSSLAEDDLYDTLLPKGISSNLMSPVSSSSVTKRETVTVESSRGGDSPSLTSPSSTIRTSSYSLYSDDSPSTRTSSYTISTKPSYEYTSITSPTTYTSSSYRSSSRSDDTDSIYSTSSMKSLYTSPERTVHEKDLCTYCRKPFVGDAKMVLDDLKINCHASCFKCEVCSSTLGHLKAGDSMWIYKRMVHCENCFEITRDKWRR